MIVSFLFIIGLSAPPLRYPLDYPPKVTAPFGTYRITHHHAGMDLYTDGDDTVAVRAAAAGRITRIRRSRTGFGRAIYIQHAGKMTVYAHLSAFGPKLRDLVREAEAEDGPEYKFNYFPEDPPRISRGELLGWIGTSGTDLVHLHFEVRIKGGPINPLIAGLEIPDAHPPRIRRLLAIPRRANAHVRHAHDEVMLDFKDGTLTEPLVIGGDVGLFVEAVDAIDGERDDLLVYELEFYVDGTLRHHVRYDRVVYGEKGHTELDFHPGLRATKVGVFNRLYREGPKVRVHKHTLRGLTDLAVGDHAARIIAHDAAGNDTEVQFTLRVEPQKPPCPVTIAPISLGGRVTAGPRTWRRRVVIQPVPDLCTGGRLQVLRDDKTLKKGVVATFLNGVPAVAIDVPANKDARFRVGTADLDGSHWIDFDSVRLHAEEPGVCGPVRIQAGEKSLFFDYPTETTLVPSPTIPGLTALSPTYRLANGWLPTRGANTISVPWPDVETSEGVGLYLIEGERCWRVGAAHQGDRLVGRTVHLGDFAVLRDDAPPKIGIATLTKHPGGPRLIIGVSDVGSGLSRIKVRFNGRRVKHEWQRGMKRVVWKVEGRLSKGNYRIQITATDRADHRVHSDQMVTWPPQG